jgi:tRNA(Ile)-lysidine synthase
MHHDPTRAVLSAVRQAARTTNGPLLPAVSGGLDSMVLLSALSAVAHRRIAAVATFDHGTGPNATHAVEIVSAAAATLGLPVVVGRLGADGSVSSREATWRAARHTFLREAASRLGARVVTAHTEDDQLETVLMRIMRGSGGRGLAALYAPGEIVRPFVMLRRASLEEYAASASVTWVDDPSNMSPVHARNRVRHDLLPALRAVAPDFDAHLLDAARQSARLRRDVDAFVDRVVRPRVVAQRLVVDAGRLEGHDRESLAVLWAALAARAGLALDWRGTRRLSAFTIEKRQTGSIPLSGGWTLEAAHSTYILRKAVVSPDAPPGTLPAAGSLIWGGFRFRVCTEEVPSSVWSASIAGSARGVVRAWCAGDRLEPAAGQPRRRVTRYLSDVGVTGADRRGWPVVVADEQVVWIPGVRRSDAATDRSGRPVRHYVCERIDR